MLQPSPRLVLVHPHPPSCGLHDKHAMCHDAGLELHFELASTEAAGARDSRELRRICGG